MTVLRKSSNLRHPDEPHVHDGRYAGTERNVVRKDARQPGRDGTVLRPGEGMEVEIDQPRRHVEAGDIEGDLCVRAGQVFSDGRDPSFADRDVTNGVNVILGIEYVAALEQDVVPV